MADSSYPSLSFNGISNSTSGISLLFSTDGIHSTLGNIVVLPDGSTLYHSESGGVTEFGFDGKTLTYNGSLDGVSTTICLVSDAQTSELKLYVGGELQDSVAYSRGPYSAGEVKLQGTKEWNVSDFRIYSKALSSGSIYYYNLDATGNGLATGRLG